MAYSTITYGEESWGNETTELDMFINDGIHTSSSDELTIVADVTSQNDGTPTSSDNVSLSENTTLEDDSSVHSILTDGVEISQVHILSVDSSGHTSYSNNEIMDQLHMLIVDSSVNTLVSAIPNVNIFLQGPKIWMGSDWQTKQIKIYRSGHWNYVPLKRWTGTEWVLV